MPSKKKKKPQAIFSRAVFLVRGVLWEEPFKKLGTTNFKNVQHWGLLLICVCLMTFASTVIASCFDLINSKQLGIKWSYGIVIAVFAYRIQIYTCRKCITTWYCIHLQFCRSLGCDVCKVQDLDMMRQSRSWVTTDVKNLINCNFAIQLQCIHSCKYIYIRTRNWEPSAGKAIISELRWWVSI